MSASDVVSGISIAIGALLRVDADEAFALAFPFLDFFASGAAPAMLSSVTSGAAVATDSSPDWTAEIDAALASSTSVATVVSALRRVEARDAALVFDVVAFVVRARFGLGATSACDSASSAGATFSSAMAAAVVSGACLLRQWSQLMNRIERV